MSFSPQTGKKVLLSILSLSILLALFIHPVHDPDFWWHLKTGEWIWEHRAIPRLDPFSFTTYEGIRPAQEPRVAYILTQYWLSQPLFYLAWKGSGPNGVILLRAGLLLLSVLLGHRFLLKKGVSFELATALSLAAGLHLTIFTNERPQLFSFFFSVLYLCELEGIKDGNKRGVVTLPLISLAWANMHASALMAWLPAGFYLMEAAYDLFRKGGGRETPRLTIAAILLSLSFTLVSPNTYHVLSVLGDLQGTGHLSTNSEFMSPIERFKDAGHAYPAYWTMMALAAAMLFSGHLNNFRRLFVLSLMIVSLSSMRFTPFFALMSPLLFGPALQKTLEGKTRVSAGMPLIAALLLSAVTLYQYRSDLYTWGVNDDEYPLHAARFIKEKHIGGRMFNFFEWGGYLMWHLPGKETFTDGRVLRLDVWDEYFNTAVNPKPAWSEVLDKYRIGFVLLPLTSPATGQPPELIYLLVNGAGWKAIYVDNRAVIFARKDAPDPEVARDMVLKETISSLTGWAEREPRNAARWSRIATALFYKGDKAAALLYYRKARELDPANPDFTNMVNLLEAGNPGERTSP